MKDKHTAAPWSIKAIDGGIGGGGGISIVAVDQNDGLLFEVAEVWGVDVDTVHDEQSIANAHLICSAPALLEALHNLLPALMSKSAMMTAKDWDAVNKANSVIAAAKAQ